jgi:hypothetical protein
VPGEKLFRSIWWLSSSAAITFLLIFVAMLGHYGLNDLSVGMVGVAVIILALFIAALSIFLNLILTFFPDVPYSAKM